MKIDLTDAQVSLIIAADQKEAELDELVKSPGWRAVW